jgi:hypothetical protein
MHVSFAHSTTPNHTISREQRLQKIMQLRRMSIGSILPVGEVHSHQSSAALIWKQAGFTTKSKNKAHTFPNLHAYNSFHSFFSVTRPSTVDLSFRKWTNLAVIMRRPRPPSLGSFHYPEVIIFVTRWILLRIEAMTNDFYLRTAQVTFKTGEAINREVTLMMGVSVNFSVLPNTTTTTTIRLIFDIRIKTL